MARTLAALSIVLAVAPASAAEPGAVSIDRLVGDIVAHNAERQFYERELAAARVGRMAAGRLADPELIVEFGEKTTSNSTPAVGGGDRTLGPGPAYQVSIAQPLEFNGRIALRRAIADRQIDLAVLGYQQYTATLAARARTLAYTLFTASLKADDATAVAKRIEEVAAVTVQRDIAGPSPLIAARILEAGALTARRQAETATADYNSALYELNQLRGTPFNAPVRLIAPPMALPPLPPQATLVEQAQTRNFEIRSLQAELDQQGLKTSLARRMRVGSVTVGPYYRQETAGTTDRFAGIHVTVPLPVWNRQAGDVAVEEGRVAQAEFGAVHPGADRRTQSLRPGSDLPRADGEPRPDAGRQRGTISGNGRPRRTQLSPRCRHRDHLPRRAAPVPRRDDGDPRYATRGARRRAAG